MILSPAPERGASLILIEGGLTAIAIAVAFCCPRLGSGFFSRIERAFTRLARKQGLAVATTGITALLLRLALLPLNPIPHPFIHDDFSFLLAADTFASGRLTNPTPAMWMHFESFHITMTPTYMSMYFPAQGLVMAAGKLLLGHPWFGILGVTSLMCAAICWMLQAWLPPTWALLGGMLAILRLGLFSYWINSYTGGGSVAALGGALVLGSFPRLMRTPRLRLSLLMTVGIIMLAMSRPYEGMLLCLPVAFVLGRWLLFGENRPTAAVFRRCTAAPLALILAAGAWMAYYDYRAFGDPLIQPYKINRATYAVAPHFVWQAPHPEPVYRHPVMRKFYAGWELDGYLRIHTLSGFLTETLYKLMRATFFFAGIVLLPPLLMLKRVLADRRTRFLVLCVFILAAGMLIETWLIPHYLSPFTAAFYALGLQAMRHLRLWSPAGQPVGLEIVRLIVMTCIVLTGLRAFAQPLHLTLAQASNPSSYWYGSRDFGERRAQIEARLEQLPGRQLVIVRYPPSHLPFDEWVYNAADIDNSKVVWSREMDPANNLALMHYYKDRKVWLVQPDKEPVEVTPYAVSEQETASLR
ncbi:MAG TPA: hypothetical protein VM554_03710 [Acidisarcina sp.]|nr:hypothetical protein [Acidisarcina sp.]